MFKKGRKKSALVVAAILVLSLVALAGCGGGGGGAEGTTDLNGAFLGQIDSWPTYAAMNDGTQEKYGLNMNMLLFDSGMPMIETLPAKEWQVADTGNVPALMATLRYDTKMIGIASNESPANAIVARPGDPVLSTTGASAEFPDIKGSADQVRGKTFLVTTVSSGHYTLSKYLEALGLSDTDVTIRNLEQPQAIKAFESGEGDYLVLWTPFLYRAYEKGWEKVADAEECGASTLMIYLAEKEFAENEENADTIARFLAMASSNVERYAAEGDALAPDIKSFFMDFAAMDMSEEDIKLDIETHELYTVDEQLELMSSGELEAMLTDAAQFFVDQNKFTQEEFDQLIAKNFNIDPSYLELAKDVTPEA